jgi:hypothetical protein
VFIFFRKSICAKDDHGTVFKRDKKELTTSFKANPGITAYPRFESCLLQRKSKLHIQLNPYLCHAKVLDARVEVVAADGILAALGNARHAPLVLELGGPATGDRGRVKLCTAAACLA